jgi:hypothetical protein
MLRAILCVVVLTAVCALSAVAAQAAAPVIEGVNVYQGRDSHCDWRGVDWHEEVNLFISDDDGLSDIASVTVIDTRGETHLLLPGDPGNPWSWWFEWYGSLWVGWRNEDLPAPPPAGSYVVTVADGEGNVDSLTTATVPDVPTVGPELLAPALDAVVYETIPTLAWGNYPPGAEAWLAVRDDEGTVWEYGPGDATSVVYNADSSASTPELIPGRTYTWSVEWDVPVDMGASDPRAYICFRQRSYGRFAVYSPTPHIEHVWLDRGINVPPDQPPTYHERLEGIDISDGDGASDVASVVIQDTVGGIHVITPATPDAGGWNQTSEYGVSVSWDHGGLPAPPVPGSYTITVTDKSGLSDTITTPVAPLVSSLYPHLLYPTPDHPVIPETVPTFIWTQGVPGATNYLNVWDLATGASLWDYASETATSVTYNVDGSAALAELVPGHGYVWQIHAWSLDDDSDPRVTIRTLQHSYGVFTTYSPLPSIQSVSVTRSRTVDAEGNESFGECATIVATGCDGWEDLAITTVDPVGRVRPGPGDCGQTAGDGPYTARQNWAQWEQTVPLAAGAYTVTATDQGGHAVSVVTQAVPEVPVPFEIGSPANHSVISTTVPTFTWDPVSGVCNYCICLEEAGHAQPVVWSWCGAAEESPSVEYNSDGAARDAELHPGSLYRLRIMAYTYGADPAHPGVWLSNSPVRVIEFCVAPQPAPVPIQGTLILIGCGPTYLSLVSGDSDQRTAGPANVVGLADVTADGSRWAYSTDDGLHVCRADGTEDVALGVQGCLPVWSPDGRRIAFVAPTPDDPKLAWCAGGGEVFVVDADGIGLTRITYAAGPDRLDGWSPDGRYLLWQHIDEASDTLWQTWVGDSDGSDAHAITGPGHPVAGGDHAHWSPDGSRIALDWLTRPTPGFRRAVLSTVAPDGSDPADLIAYTFPDGPWTGPGHPVWSPDGSQIAFLSLHQALPDLGAPADFEAYIMDADGSNVHRITTDFVPNDWLQWIGPNTSPGPDVSTIICDTTITFGNVTEPGVTTAVVSDAPPAPAPTGFQFIGEYYDLRTTAQISGPVTVQIHYDDSEVPGGQEEWLSLLHWEDGHWVDVTVRPIDTINNIITGQVASLSPFAVVLELDTAPPTLTVPPDVSVTTTDPNGAAVEIGVATATDDRDPNPAVTNDAPAVFPVGATVVTWTATDAAGNVATAVQTVTVTLQGYANFTWVAPMANADKRLFKRGSTIPVKFTITDMGGSPATDATATLAIRYLHDGAPEGEPLTVSTANGDEGDTFRHTADGQYVFNLSTKPPEWYPYYTFLAEVTLDDGQVFSQAFSLK